MKKIDKGEGNSKERILWTIFFGGAAIGIFVLFGLIVVDNVDLECLLSFLIVAGPLLLVIIGALFAQSKKESDS